MRIDDGDVEDRVQRLAHGVEHEGHAAGLRPQQVAERRMLRVVLGWREARALGEVHHRHRHVAEFLAGAAGRLAILALQLGMAQQGLARVALHEGKIQRPPRQPEQGHPDQLLLEEKAQERDAPVEHLLQHRDVHPALVVAQHQVVAVAAQPLQPLDLPAHTREQAEQDVVDADPAFRDRHQRARARLPDRMHRQQQLEQGEREDEDHVQQDVERKRKQRQRHADERWQPGKHGGDRWGFHRT